MISRHLIERLKPASCWPEHFRFYPSLDEYYAVPARARFFLLWSGYNITENTPASEI